MPQLDHICTICGQPFGDQAVGEPRNPNTEYPGEINLPTDPESMVAHIKKSQEFALSALRKKSAVSDAAREALAQIAEITLIPAPGKSQTLYNKSAEEWLGKLISRLLAEKDAEIAKLKESYRDFLSNIDSL